jgi:hypothetical protein
MNPTTSANQHRRQLQPYGTPLFEYQGQGTVRWKNGTSRNLAFEAGQFSTGKIIVAGRLMSTGSDWSTSDAKETVPLPFSGQGECTTCVG